MEHKREAWCLCIFLPVVLLKCTFGYLGNQHIVRTLLIGYEIQCGWGSDIEVQEATSAWLLGVRLHESLGEQEQELSPV